MKRKDDLKGELAIVTGASSGIGLCFCRELASRGADLLMVSNQAGVLEQCAADIESDFSVKAHHLFCDLTRPDCDSVITRFLDENHLEADILINNAGIFSFAPLTDTPEGKINAFIDLHVRAVTTLSRTFASRFVNRGKGKILNMSSMSCWMPMPGLAMYSATKAYIRVFSRALHYELRDTPVRLTVACPGGIATSLFGLPDNLIRLALRLHAIQTPEKFVKKAVDKMLKGKMQYINGPVSRFAILFIGILPTRVRMLVKHLMLDKNIKRP